MISSNRLFVFQFSCIFSVILVCQAFPEWPFIASHLLGSSLLQQPLLIASYDHPEANHFLSEMSFGQYPMSALQAPGMLFDSPMYPPMDKSFAGSAYAPPMASFPLSQPMIIHKKTPSSSLSMDIDEHDKTVTEDLNEAIKMAKDEEESSVISEDINHMRSNDPRHKSRSLDHDGKMMMVNQANSVKNSRLFSKLASYSNANGYTNNKSPASKMASTHPHSVGSNKHFKSNTSSMSKNRNSNYANHKTSSSSVNYHKASGIGNKMIPPISHQYEDWSSLYSKYPNNKQLYQWPTNSYSFPVQGLKAHYTPINNSPNSYSSRSPSNYKTGPPAASSASTSNHVPTSSTQSTLSSPEVTSSLYSSSVDIRKPSGSSQRRRYVMSGRSPNLYPDTELYTSGAYSKYPMDTDRYPNAWTQGTWSGSNHHWPNYVEPQPQQHPNPYVYETTEEMDNNNEHVNDKSNTFRNTIQAHSNPQASMSNESVRNKLTTPLRPNNHSTSSKSSNDHLNSAELLLNARPVQSDLDQDDPMKKSELPVKSSRHTISSNNGDVTVVTETVYRGIPRLEHIKTTTESESPAYPNSFAPTLDTSLDQMISSNQSKINSLTVQLKSNQIEKTPPEVTSVQENSDSNKQWSQSDSMWNNQPEVSKMNPLTNFNGDNSKNDHKLITNLYPTNSYVPYVRANTPEMTFAKIKNKTSNDGLSIWAILLIIIASLIAAILFAAAFLVLMYRMSFLKKRHFLRFNRRAQNCPEQLETNDAVRSTANLTKTNPLHSLITSGKNNSQAKESESAKANQDTVIPCSQDITFRSDQKSMDLTSMNLRKNAHQPPKCSGVQSAGQASNQNKIKCNKSNDSGWIRTLKTTAEPNRHSNALSRILSRVSGQDEAHAVHCNHQMAQSSPSSSSSSFDTITNDHNCSNNPSASNRCSSHQRQSNQMDNNAHLAGAINTSSNHKDASLDQPPPICHPPPQANPPSLMITVPTKSAPLQCLPDLPDLPDPIAMTQTNDQSIPLIQSHSTCRATANQHPVTTCCSGNQARLYLMCNALWTGPTCLQSLNLHHVGQLYDTLSQKLGFRCVTLIKGECYASISLQLPYGCTVDLIREYGFTLVHRFTSPLHPSSFIYEAYEFPASF